MAIPKPPKFEEVKRYVELTISSITVIAIFAAFFLGRFNNAETSIQMIAAITVAILVGYKQIKYVLEAINIKEVSKAIVAVFKK